MSAFSPGSCNSQVSATPREQSHISSYQQQHPANVRALRVFRSILSSSFGPSGFLKMIQNQSGGHLTLTSSSQRLLQSMSLSKPILKLIAAAVEGHLKIWSDGGLYTALLTCALIEECWESGLHPVLCVSVNEILRDLCLQTLNQQDGLRIPIDLASMDAMLSLVRPVIGSKPGCGMDTGQVTFISSLVMQAFVSSIPSPNSQQVLTLPQVQIVGVESWPISGSHFVQGVLMAAPDIPTSFKRDLGTPGVHTGPEGGGIRVALYDISLAGDSEEFIDVRYELSPGLHAEDATLAAMKDLVDHLVAHGVGLVACQRVIHPSVKGYLRARGVQALDRLSLLHIREVQRITDAEILSSLDTNVPASSLGHLTDIRHHVMFKKSYLHLINTASPQCCLVLCHYTEQALEELKHVCQVALHTLTLALKDPWALPGAGCLEFNLAHHIRRQVKELGDSLWQDIGCTKDQFLGLAETFATCLEAVAMAINKRGEQHITDVASHHRWLLPSDGGEDTAWLQGKVRCACGLKTAEEHAEEREWSLVVGLQGGAQRSGIKEDGAHLQRSKTSGDRYDDSNPVSNSHKKTVNEKAKPSSKSDKFTEILMPGNGRDTCGTMDADSGSSTASLSERNLILDSFAVKCNAFRVAVETANIVLRIGHTIEDIN
ncbi:molecular chaperone MKKS-like [Diadema antillarum]|uniref:molecular chaperone MKKS-like n=1 Tax=Diadema antillarum TaxID=105358 RepID=UPI003A8771B9